jgi:hypothetical protein
MATCNNCLHIDVCAHRYEKLCKGTKVEDINHACTKFKERTRYAEVVRCKDCKHYHNRTYCINVKTMDYGLTIRHTKGEDFCSYGERKDNE